MFVVAAAPCAVHMKDDICANECKEDKCPNTDKQSCDACGSFACCALCIGFLMPETKLLVSLALNDIMKKNMFYEFSKNPCKGISSIWQPPKTVLDYNRAVSSTALIHFFN